MILCSKCVKPFLLRLEKNAGDFYYAETSAPKMVFVVRSETFFYSLERFFLVHFGGNVKIFGKAGKFRAAILNYR